MKNYYIGKFEEQTALYCSELNEYALETEGNILCTEEDNIIEIFGTSDKEEIFKVAKLEPMHITLMAELNSSGLLDWILAKEPLVKWMWHHYDNMPGTALNGLIFGNDECWIPSGEFYQYLIDDDMNAWICYYDVPIDCIDYACIDYNKPTRIEPARFDF